MTPQEITEKLKSQFGDAITETKLEGVVDPFVKIKPETMKEVSLFLRDDADLQLDFLMCLSGIDLGKGNLGVVYNLYSMTKRHKLTIKVEVPREKAEVPSVESVWKTANWHEREAYDLVGITFTGHPDLRRILLPTDWEGHPLRKDYKVPEYYQGMKVPY
ncbi:MAG: NADH-quinone oxidoreductase subunit C [Ignavibacteriales bacterium]|nr:NADH-quinone oxidoreductase subunit C [Ignavibacteriales bacterium]